MKKITLLALMMGILSLAVDLRAAGPAPAFTLKDLQGKDVTLQQQRGKVVLLNFWATWCAPCKVEMPWLMQLQKTHGPDRFVVLGVSMDEEGARVVAPFIGKQRFVLEGTSQAINFPILIGTTKMAAAFGDIEAMPTTFLIDQAGTQVRRVEGPIDLKEMDRSIRTLLARK